jgi:hypothetical protein
MMSAGSISQDIDDDRQIQEALDELQQMQETPQLPVFSANNLPVHARETGRKSLPGAGLRAGEGG